MTKTDEYRDLNRAIGTALRAARIAKGWSQTQVAEVLGVTFQQVQKYEKGTNRIAASTLAILAQRLGVPLASLLPTDAGGSADLREASVLARLAGNGLATIDAIADLPADVQFQFRIAARVIAAEIFKAWRRGEAGVAIDAGPSMPLAGQPENRSQT